MAKKKSTKLSDVPERLKRTNKLGLLAFAIVFTIIGAVTFRQLNAAPKVRGPSLTLSPTSQTVGVGGTLVLQVWADSQDRPVNAVQANLSYDVNSFDFVSIDAAGSAFTIEAPSSGGGGIVQIARGNILALTGRNLVATVHLRSKAIVKRTSVRVNSDSILAEASTNLNILVSRGSGTYRIN